MTTQFCRDEQYHVDEEYPGPVLAGPEWAEGDPIRTPAGRMWPYRLTFGCAHPCPRTAFARSDEEYVRDVAEAGRRHCPDLCVVGGGCECEECEKARAQIKRVREGAWS